MFRRIRNIATWLSIALLATTVALGVAAKWINPWYHRISLTSDFHISVDRWSAWDSRLVFFNRADWGPYKGSIIAIVDEHGNEYPPRLEEHAFGDTAGIYYRYFRWSDSTLWTLALGLWYPAVIFAIMPTWRYIQRRRRIARSAMAMHATLNDAPDRH